MIHVGLDLHHRTSYVRAMDDHGEVFPGWRSASYPHPSPEARACEGVTTRTPCEGGPRRDDGHQAGMVRTTGRGSVFDSVGSAMPHLIRSTHGTLLSPFPRQVGRQLLPETRM